MMEVETIKSTDYGLLNR